MMNQVLSSDQAQGGELPRQCFKDKASLQPRKRSTQAEMRTISESHVLIGLAQHLEPIGLSKLLLISIG